MGEETTKQKRKRAAGKPYKSPEERKTVRLDMRLDREHAERLERMAATAGVSKSALIRQWIDENGREI